MTTLLKKNFNPPPDSRPVPARFADYFL